VDGVKTYDGPWSADEHDNGEIWSSALWNIYRKIGGDSMSLSERQAARDTLLKSLILSHFSMPVNGSMPDGAEALMNTHAELDQFRGKYLREMLDSFHARHILLCNAAADLYMKRDGADTGVDHLTGPVFWDSPDLWIRNANDNGTVHQDVISGRDNYFYARVHNRGTATARAFVVTFNVKPFAGVQFVYPNDFVPFISAAVGFNLAPGASTIVKAKWPKALVPAPGVHACWVASVYTPTESAPAGKHVWEAHELAQKNLTIVHAKSGDTFTIRFELGNLANTKAGVYRLEVRRPAEFAEMPVALVHPKAEQITQLFQSATLAPVHIGDGGAAAAPAANLQAKLLKTATETSIQFNPGELTGFPFQLAAMTQSEYGLKVAVPAKAKAGDEIKLQVMQRDSQGQVVGGITVQVVVNK
jgi:hypothetical protein